MNCQTARESILEAAPEVLAMRAGHPLARHLEECPHCRAAAETVLAEQAALYVALKLPLRIPTSAGSSTRPSDPTREKGSLRPFRPGARYPG